MSYPLVCGHRGRGLWWCRVCGYGLHVKDTRRRALVFSERVLGRGRQIGPWRVRLLTPPRQEGA